jgi:hypothetical protein
VIGLETRPDFINRIANSDGVREYIRPDGKPMDWTPIAERSPAITRTVVLSNGEDALAAFEWTATGTYQSHTLFMPTCRGRRAIDTAVEMVRWMFMHGATCVWGSTPRANRKACLFNRWIGAVELPTSDETDIVFVTDGDGAMICFNQTPAGWEFHSMFRRSCRGRKAIEAARLMFAWLVGKVGPLTLLGTCPVDNRAVRWFCRALGMSSAGIMANPQFGPVEIFRKELSCL